MKQIALSAVLGLAVAGCTASEPQEDTRTAVYLDRETKKPVVARLQPTPAVHPETGKRTLVRALYCPKCRRWKAVPPDGNRNGHPGNHKCRQHGCALTADGPLPRR